MAQRRFHSKSRLGCVQCKKNRTKCDESRPTCSRCQRIGVECSFTEEGSDLVFIQDQSGPSEVRSTAILSSEESSNPSSTAIALGISSPQDDQLVPPVTTINTKTRTVESQFTASELENLRLMNHYTLNTSKSFSEITLPRGEDPSFWATWVVELALKHDFLLHGLLGISALHLRLLGVDSQRNMVTAIHHHDLGVELFQPHLATITPDNFDAVFAFFCLVAMYSFAFQRCPESEGNILDKFHQVLTLIRGSSVLAKLDSDILSRSRWAALIPPVPFEANVRLTDEVEDMLFVLRRRATALGLSHSEEEAYLAAIQALRYSLIVVQVYQSQTSTLTLFPVSSPPGFWPLVQIRQPLALAILANYAVSLHWLRKNIWVEGWGKEVVRVIREALPLDWHECIAWALRETERD